MGRKPLDETQLAKRGSRVKKELPVLSASAVPEVPSELIGDEVATEKFIEVANMLAGSGYLEEYDVDVLTRYAELHSQNIRAKHIIKNVHKGEISHPVHGKEGLTGYKLYPEYKLYQSNTVVMNNLAKELGLTPSSRGTILQKMKVVPADKPAHGNSKNDKSRFFSD